MSGHKVSHHALIYRRTVLEDGEQMSGMSPSILKSTDPMDP